MATSAEAIDESRLIKAPRVELLHRARSDSAWICWAAQTHRSRFPVKALRLAFSDHGDIEAEKGQRPRRAHHTCHSPLTKRSTAQAMGRNSNRAPRRP